MKLLATAWLSVSSLTAVGISFLPASQEEQEDMVKPKTHEAFQLDELMEAAERANKRWHPFLDRSTLSCGLYRLTAGGTDTQGPHELDEVYYVVSGRSRFVAAEEELDAEPGSILFVQAGVEHRFFDIEEDLVVVVFFSKAADEK